MHPPSLRARVLREGLCGPEVGAARRSPPPPKRRKKDERKYPSLPSTIPQSEAKQWLPPGAYIWRGLQRREWAAHLKPYPRVSCRWAEFTEEGALREILRRVWRQYLEMQGKTEAECPISGLFPSGAAAGAAASSA